MEDLILKLADERTKPRITQEVFQHYYETPSGNTNFGGNFYIGADVNNYSNKLNGTTSIINLLFPFSPMISPVAEAWMRKLDRRESNNEIIDIFSEESQYGEAARKIGEISTILKRAQDETIEDGNLGELVTLHLLKNNGSLDGIDDTIAKEELENKTVKYYKTERAIKFGELAYEQIMNLGTDVKLIDYQTVASDRDLFDVGFFDFVIEADGELILIDMKTGSWSDSKLQKTRFQLLGSYKKKFAGIFGKEPDKVIIIAAIQDEIKVGQVKKFKTFGKTIDITNDDPNGHYVEIYERTAKLYKQLYDTGIWKQTKNSNLVSF